MEAKPDAEGFSIPNYGHDSEKFTVRIYYGGEFVNTPSTQYVGGKWNAVDHCDPDTWSLCVLDKLVAQLGCESSGIGYYYRVPGRTLDNGLMYIFSDNDAMDLARFGREFKSVDVYVYHTNRDGQVEGKKTNTDVANADIEQPPPQMQFQSFASPQKKGQRKKCCATKKPSPMKNFSPRAVRHQASNSFCSQAENANATKRPLHADLGGGESQTNDHFKEARGENVGDSGREQFEPRVSADGHAKNLQESEDVQGGELCSENEEGIDPPESNIEFASEPTDGGKGQKGKGIADVHDFPSSERAPQSKKRKSSKTSTRAADSGTSAVHTETSSEDGDMHDSDYELSEEEDMRDIMRLREADWMNVASRFTRGEPEEGEPSHAKDNDDGGEPEDELLDSDDQPGSHHSDDDSDSNGQRQHFQRFRPETDMEDPQFKVGMRFSSRNEFKQACKHHGVRHGRIIRFIKNDKRRVKACCKACEWFVSIAIRPGKGDYQIHSMNGIHSCGRSFNHGCATSTFLSAKYKEDIRISNLGVGDIVQKVHSDLNINVSRRQAYLAKKKAKKLIEGDYVKQYNKLPDYCAELLRTNPGSNIFIRTTETAEGDVQFQRMYVCFSACKQGFLAGCRPVVGLDGCFLKGPHKGMLLAAVGMDPNDQIYPIAVAIVEGENKVTWKWFLRELKQDLQISYPEQWTFITDKQKGLINAIFELFNGAEHRMCAWHMIKNFRAVHKGMALVDRVWAAAKATYMNKFVHEMEAIKEMDETAYKWLVEHTSPKHWSRAHFRTTPKCDIIANNICESFNAAILGAREKPILGLLEDIRYYLMVRMETKRRLVSRMKGNLCPKIQAKLEIMKQQSSTCIATRAGELKFEIRCMYGDQYTVDLVKRTCSCRKWDLKGIPCAHAVAAISTTNEPPEMFVHEWYMKDAYTKAYDHVIYPVNGEHLWEKTGGNPMLPPERVTLPGRPKKLRRKGVDENPSVHSKVGNVHKLSRAGQMSYKCRICKAAGHNARNCPQRNSSHSEAPVDEPIRTPDPMVREDEHPTQESVVQPVATEIPPSGCPRKQVKVFRCSLCRQPGHNRSKCGSTVANLFRMQKRDPFGWMEAAISSRLRSSETAPRSQSESTNMRYTGKGAEG